MRATVIAGVFALALWAATPANTVNEAIEVVRVGLRRGESDGSIAKALRKLRLGESMELRVIEELESAGAGEKTVAELRQLREASSGLPAPPTPLALDALPEPSAEERRKVLIEVRSAALNYSRSLPDFICTQRVRRSDNSRGAWQVRDSLEIKLTFFDRREEYRLLSVNGRPAVRRYQDVGGVTSQGEFGSLLQMVFDPKSRAEFIWDHWTTLRKRRAHVFAFRTPVRIYRLEVQHGMGARTGVTVGQRGFVYVDRETNDILRIIADADGIPAEFPVQSSSTLLDYQLTRVGSGEFLLPLRAEVRMESGRLLTRNEVEFRGYQKFSSETTVTFDPK